MLFASATLSLATARSIQDEPKKEPQPKKEPELKKEPSEQPPVKLEPAEIPTTFRSQVVVDQRSTPDNFRNRTNKMHDFVCEHELNPTIAVFARTIPSEKDGALGKLTNALHRLASEEKVMADKFGVFMIFLSIDMEFHLDDKRDVQGDLIKKYAEVVASPMVPLGLAAKKSKQVEAWKIGDEEITVIFYHRQKEVKRWAFAADKPEAGEVAEIVRSVKKQLGFE